MSDQNTCEAGNRYGKNIFVLFKGTAPIKGGKKITSAKNPGFPAARGLIRSARRRWDDPSRGFVSPHAGAPAVILNFSQLLTVAAQNGPCKTRRQGRSWQPWVWKRDQAAGPFWGPAPAS